MSTLSDMTNYVLDFSLKVAELKPEFYRYVNDKSVDLDVRWDFWVKAPFEFKEELNFIEDFDSLPEEYIMYEGPMHAEKYETITALQILENIMDNNHDLRVAGDYDKTIDISAFKEEILSKNMYSFCYNW